jgi:hypothetical protein
MVRQRAGACAANQAIDADQKSGERFPGAGGGGDEDILTGTNDGPTPELRLGGRTKAVKPFLYEGVEGGNHWLYFPMEGFRQG